MEKVHCYVLFILILRAEKKGRHDANFVVSGGTTGCHHDAIIKWKHFSRYCPFVLRIHWSPVNSPHKGQWHGALILSLISAWINDRVNNREAGDLGCHLAVPPATTISFERSKFYEKNYIIRSAFSSWFHDFMQTALLQGCCWSDILFKETQQHAAISNSIAYTLKSLVLSAPNPKT